MGLPQESGPGIKGVAPARTRLIAAIDTADPQRARFLINALEGKVDAIKLGLEFTYSCGFDAAREIAARHPVFLDLKLHDIPNTVAAGLKALCPLKPVLTTIHASGGREMIARSREVLQEAFGDSPERPRLLAVTVLTSMDAAGLNEIGVPASPLEQVIRLGKMAVEAGADGLVCSAHEITALREALGPQVELVVPGIRPAGSVANDQKRVMTPAQAARAGASWIVVGRPITQAEDPARAATLIQEELASA
ncbi:orotidine-5'-phosphate decarboxylase [Oecophyllibacter saccharovorans]|uniref:Orotidine 5'-phosphate decarboxylase n=1 Tax=Oecophyllibacter saccharovorans TaxID=2558360 RepID=A0A506UQL7_9PROT|nr:orotidine-5'-phosphate decarboxylase [Oecophyllibacter saccharovorans]TPW35614.1 orotidine-5'-phosphate decarboxylase [Oecophyllibacter saccharovorans]